MLASDGQISSTSKDILGTTSDTFTDRIVDGWPNGAKCGGRQIDCVAFGLRKAYLLLCSDHWTVDLLYKLNFSQNEGSALLWACRNGQRSTARLSLTYSLQRGSRPSKEQPICSSNEADIDFTDASGGTPLMKAASKGHENVAKTLLCKGANANFRKEWGGTALLTAAVFRHVGFLHLLLEKGVELDYMVGGGTALHWAAAKGHKDIVSVLLQNGARVDFVDELGNTAIDRVKCHGHVGVAKVIADLMPAALSGRRGGAGASIIILPMYYG
ncbi:hypothetical protein ACJ73_04051 [Blastomyces percursus]|uniref:Uncharacterized protein n=1 Tax=Blastomyces percursus TaxID=1658174 RepID=A0A1J9Q946_9EURO|nr:hypothetical protein ACJ73_04051 [Blastomyces percursus]